MVSISNNPVWTPGLIEQDKALKEKYGPGAHVIPATEADYRRNGLQVPEFKNDLKTDVLELSSKKNNAIDYVKSAEDDNKALNIFGIKFPIFKKPLKGNNIKLRNFGGDYTPPADYTHNFIMDPMNPASPMYNPLADPCNIASPMNPCNPASGMMPGM